MKCAWKELEPACRFTSMSSSRVRTCPTRRPKASSNISAAVLADNGGKVLENEYWGVKTMAYKINKNRKGHYAYLRTDAPAPAVQEMERLMRLHDDVMRVLTIKVDA
jgi:ribosomal protein S6